MEMAINGWTLSIAAAAMVVAFVAWFASRYRKVGPNEVLIVSGRSTTYTNRSTGEEMTKNFRIYHGGGTFIVPIRERTHRMSVELMTLEIRTPEFYTKLGVPIVVDAIAQIKVRSDDVISTAMAVEMFLSKSPDEMNEIAHQMMEGHLRGVISTLPFEEIHANPEAFAQSVQRLTAAELANMGIQVVSFTIRAVQDPSGYLEALGRPQMALIKRDAVLGESASNRDATVGSAAAEREASVATSEAHRASELARIQAELDIAEAVKKHDVRREVNRAEVAQKQVELEGVILSEKLGVSKMQRTLQIEVEDLEIARKERELVHSVRKPAEAERFRIEALAMAHRRELNLTAEAHAEAMRLEGMAEADVIRAKGVAEADAIRLRELAEAEGLQARGMANAAAMKGKAEAWQAYGQAAVAELFIEKLPEVARAVAAPLANIDRITLVGSNGSTGIDRVTKGVTDVMAQIPGVASLMQNLRLDSVVDRLALVGDRSDKLGINKVSSDPSASLERCLGARGPDDASIQPNSSDDSAVGLFGRGGREDPPA